VGTIQAYLELVPFLGLFPVPGVRAIASLVSHLPKYYHRRHASCRLLLRALSRYQRVDALHGWIAGRLVELGVSPAKVRHPARNCVDHVRFRPEPKTRSVTFTARAIGLKNPDLLLDAARRVLARDPEVVFHVLGVGPRERRLRQLVARSGLDARLRLGYLPDPSPLVNRSLVHTSIEAYDNVTNQSLLEGMAAGCAIVATDAGHTREVVTPDVGLVVPPRAEALAEAITDLLARPDASEILGRNARAKVLREHNVEAYVDYLVALHDEAAEA
jgi:glycosyltransferase involved in cell wall biosynthesis